MRRVPINHFVVVHSFFAAWQASQYGQRMPPGVVDTIKSDTRNITMKVRKATHSGTVTLLSREHGRGLPHRLHEVGLFLFRLPRRVVPS